MSISNAGIGTELAVLRKDWWPYTSEQNPNCSKYSHCHSLLIVTLDGINASLLAMFGLG